MMIDVDYDITNGVNHTVFIATSKAIEMNDKESFIKLDSFAFKLLVECISNNAIKYFSQYSIFPAFCYLTAYEKNKLNPNIALIQKYYCGKAVSTLKSIIQLGLSKPNYSTINIEDRKNLNYFYYWSYYGFSNLFYNLIQTKDFDQFKYAIQQFNQTLDYGFSVDYELDFKIRYLMDSDGSNIDVINVLKEEKDASEKPLMYKRHALVGIKCWVLYLFSINKIDKDFINELFKSDWMKVPYSNQIDAFKDILFFRNDTHSGYMGWSNWDHIERMDGEFYHPPIAEEWLTFGYLADQIREDTLYINLNDVEDKEIQQIELSYDKIKGYIQTFKGDFEKWGALLNSSSQQDLENKCDRILNKFKTLFDKSNNERNSSIVQTNLSVEKINNFKQIIGASWKSQARIHSIFKLKNNKQIILDPEVKLKIIGNKTFFEKAKTMFIDSPYYNNIYGVESMGGYVGRWEDDYFFSTIIKPDSVKLEGDSLLDILEKGIAFFSDKDILPDLIFISTDYSYKDNAFLKDKRFKIKSNSPDAHEGVNAFYLGDFDEIPIYTIFSSILKNKAVICNFETSFLMKYKTNPNWYEEELNVDVREISNDEAERKFAEDPERWQGVDNQIEMNHDEIINLIKTSVMIDIWTTLDFEILNKNSYLVGYIQPENLKGN